MRSVFDVPLASTRKVNLFQDASRLQKKRDSRGKRTNGPCPADSLRGICYLLKKLLLLAIPPVLVAGEKSGNTGNTDTHLRGSPPGVAVEPGLPTEALARTNGPGRTRRRFCLRQSLRQWKHLNILPPKVGQSSCDEARALPHPPIASAQEGSADAQETKAGARDGGPHSPDEPGCLWPPFARHCSEPRTGLTIGLVGQVNGTLS